MLIVKKKKKVLLFLPQILAVATFWADWNRSSFRDCSWGLRVERESYLLWPLTSLFIIVQIKLTDMKTCFQSPVNKYWRLLEKTWKKGTKSLNSQKDCVSFCSWLLKLMKRQKMLTYIPRVIATQWTKN